MEFWTKRKAAVKAAEEREAAELEEQAVAEERAKLEEKTDEEVLEELDLPDPDSLQEGDDFKPFLAKTVPERLRRRALRKLWLVNPTLANLDGLVDYGEDFTDAATVVENLQTTYQVGKGMLEHVKKMEEEAKAALDAENREVEGDHAPDESAVEEADGEQVEEGEPEPESEAPNGEDDRYLTDGSDSVHNELLSVSGLAQDEPVPSMPRNEEVPEPVEEIIVRLGKRMRFS